MSTSSPSSDDPHRIEVLAVNSKEARALYKKRVPIYPKLVHGRWRTLKWASMILLLGIYYLTPWIRWDRAGSAHDQAVMVDFEGRRFYFFWLELWPQEVYYITGLLILAALGIFLASALFGRVWCGYACPQTVWTDLYIYVERLIEGDRGARMRLASSPWSISKLIKKVSKHALWLLIAAATGGAWVFYFGDAPTLTREIFAGQASLTVYVFVGMLTFTTYSLAGTMREQVCTYMCPWPRIQAAMTDPDALGVTYRRDRGEPRGPHKKGTSWEGRGDCIDCNQCVAACPQGIDIREGDQLECINCALCIDACNDVMAKVGRPKGLIAYDTPSNITRRQQRQKPQLRFVRPRTMLYAVVMLVVGGVMLNQLLHRATLALDVIRDRSPPFVRMADGAIRNDYAIKVINRAAEERDVMVSLSGLDGARLESAHEQVTPQGVLVHAQADGVVSVRLHVVGPLGLEPGAHKMAFAVRDPHTGEIARSPSAFLAGEP